MLGSKYLMVFVLMICFSLTGCLGESKNDTKAKVNDEINNNLQNSDIYIVKVLLILMKMQNYK